MSQIQHSGKPNKFAGLLDIAGVKPQPAVEMPADMRSADPRIESARVSVPVPVKAVSSASGKRSDPNYQQTSLYVRKDLYKRVRKEMMDRDADDFSDLVEELLTLWLGTTPLAKERA